MVCRMHHCRVDLEEAKTLPGGKVHSALAKPSAGPGSLVQTPVPGAERCLRVGDRFCNLRERLDKYSWHNAGHALSNMWRLRLSLAGMQKFR